MYKINCKFTTDQGTLKGGTLVEEKELKKHFSTDEIEEYIELGHIARVDIPEMNDSSTGATLEELLEAETSELKIIQLKKLCEHFKLDTKGKRDVLIQRIEDFEKLLDLPLESMEDTDVKQVAAYYEVDTSLELEEMIDAIEEASD